MFNMSQSSLKFFIITALLQLVPKTFAGPEIICDPNPRSFYMSDKQYGDPKLDIEGKLFPRMAKLLCDERFCPPQGRPECSYAVQPYIRNMIRYTWSRPESLDTACSISSFVSAGFEI
ncbi:hypothetical protein BKA66DRAFT_479343 [Pyrenochaeta sp. MPI-SDFR-AT-0127]|nr:hypothetical protein BKA66DRAFT_479343 [Pyrenochaeta sp. MPI-SDFR-AT-0127]